MDKELKSRISKLSDGELLEMVERKSSDYRKEALDYAARELESRGIQFSLKTKPSTVASDESESWECEACGAKVKLEDSTCPECGADIIEIADDDEVAIGEEPVAWDKGGSSERISSQASAIIKRYKDAYLYARWVDGIGRFIKAIGIILAILLILAMLFVGNYTGYNLVVSLLAGIILGVLIGVPFYIGGILVSAGAQILKASLDSAVNSSPFLTNEHRAKIMSLPNA